MIQNIPKIKNCIHVINVNTLVLHRQTSQNISKSTHGTVHCCLCKVKLNIREKEEHNHSTQHLNEIDILAMKRIPIEIRVEKNLDTKSKKMSSDEFKLNLEIIKKEIENDDSIIYKEKKEKIEKVKKQKGGKQKENYEDSDEEK